jgi:hypothetical protein
MRRLLLTAALALAAVTSLEAQIMTKYAVIVVIDNQMRRVDMTRILDDLSSRVQGVNCPTNPEFDCEYYRYNEDPTAQVVLLLAVNGDVRNAVGSLLDRRSYPYEVRFVREDTLSREELITRASAIAYHNWGALFGRVVVAGDRLTQTPLLSTFTSLAPQ